MELESVKLTCSESKLTLLHQLMPPTPVPPVTVGCLGEVLSFPIFAGLVTTLQKESRGELVAVMGQGYAMPFHSTSRYISWSSSIKNESTTGAGADCRTSRSHSVRLAGLHPGMLFAAGVRLVPFTMTSQGSMSRAKGTARVRGWRCNTEGCLVAAACPCSLACGLVP